MAHFAFLILTAIALYYAKGPILVIAAIVGFVNAWLEDASLRARLGVDPEWSRPHGSHPYKPAG